MENNGNNAYQFTLDNEKDLKALGQLNYNGRWVLIKMLVEYANSVSQQSLNRTTDNCNIPVVSNRALWRIEPYFDGISTAVTTYKVVDQNGILQYMGDRNQCEYFLQHGC